VSEYNDQFKQPDKARPYMAIHGGHRVYLDDPKPEDFDPVRTAYSLAHEHRYGGNYGPYSVAQHAVLVAEVAGRLLEEADATREGFPRTHDLFAEGDVEKCPICRPVLLAALHHDDTESILGDMPQPVKSQCPDFKALEGRLERALGKRYGIDINHSVVKEADRIVFCAEIRCLVPRENQHLYGVYGDPTYRQDIQPDWEDLEFWTPDQARKRYLQAHLEYGGTL